MKPEKETLTCGFQIPCLSVQRVAVARQDALNAAATAGRLLGQVAFATPTLVVTVQRRLGWNIYEYIYICIYVHLIGYVM